MPTRTVATAKELLQCAKIGDAYNASNVCAIQCTAEFNAEESGRTYNLFQLSDPQLVADLLQVDDSNSEERGVLIHLKASHTDGGPEMGRVSAICNDQLTFNVVETETSNSLLLTDNTSLFERGGDQNNPTVKPELIPVDIRSIKHTYYELINNLVAPPLHALKQALQSSVYYGPLEEGSDDEVGADRLRKVLEYLTVEQLMNKFPSSLPELRSAMRSLRACEVDGYVRLVDSEFLTQVIRDTFSCADEHGWNWRQNGFPLKALLENISDRHPDSALLATILGHFFARRSTSLHLHPPPTQTSDCRIFPRNSSICRLFGEHLLSVTKHFFVLSDFLAVWRAALPEGLRPKLLCHLTCAGRAYLNSVAESANQQGISLLRSEDLPDEPLESRLSALFERRSRWGERELAGYFADLLPKTYTRNDGIHCVRLMGSSDPMSLIPDASNDSDSDFDYRCEFDGASPDREEDVPKPVGSAVSALLLKHCRLTTMGSDRIYTQKIR